jgi:hypothetical protein
VPGTYREAPSSVGRWTELGKNGQDTIFVLWEGVGEAKQWASLNNTRGSGQAVCRCLVFGSGMIDQCRWTVAWRVGVHMGVG